MAEDGPKNPAPTRERIKGNKCGAVSSVCVLTWFNCSFLLHYTFLGAFNQADFVYVWLSRFVKHAQER